MRVVGWAEKLYEAIDACSQREFAWGSHDCCLFAADVLLAMTGIDYAAPVRGYTTEEEALAIIAGYGDMEAMITALTGVEPVDAKGKNVRRGDLVIAQLEHGDTMGVCVGVNAVYAQVRGTAMRRTSMARVAWRIE